MLTVCDAGRALHAAVDDIQVDYLVAALSADPETIDELQHALRRFVPREAADTFFADWRPGTCAEPSDGAFGIIDLAARLVVIAAADYDLSPRAGVGMVDRNGKEIGIPYHVADAWLLTTDGRDWQACAETRRRERLAAPPLDARAVLYGAVCRFIAEACWAEAAPLDEDGLRTALSAIHARWLTTPRADLGDQTPRDVLLARCHHIDLDLQDRAHQWSFIGTCPAALSPESAAYRHGGFGTHEIVVYYDLVRFLLSECWDRLAKRTRTQPPSAEALSAEVRRLEGRRNEWLGTLNFEDFSGHVPAEIIANERARVPEGTTGKHAMVDDDCPMCQMMADDPGPYFWHLDGSHMDNDFAFSFHATREEWEAEQREWEEYHQRCEAERAAKQATKTESVWQTSYVAEETMTGSPALAVLGLATYLAELTQNLKDAAAEQATIDTLNRIFGNLRDAAADPSAALVEPVIERLNEALAGIAEQHPDLAAKCDDLQRQLRTFGRRLTAEPWDEELPF